MASTFDLLQWLDEDSRRAFLSSARRRRYAAGQLIYTQGEPGNEMYRLLSGSVRVSVTRSDGRKVVFMLLEPGDAFGESSLVDDEQRPQSAEALTDVEVEALDLQSFNHLRAQYRSFDNALLKLLARQMRAVSTIYADTNLNDLSERVATRILTTARSFGTEADGGVRLSLRISQAEIALMVGASRQSVNKVLQRFQSDGLLTIEYGNILIRDLPGLQRMAGS